ncbi:ZIP family zinc transporter [Longispora sp. NPDC051575]|uniref:ZIP family metal transporter n=1 Tax=Longispora sp. NPDC051575 TaxID=3154943 RepID=UPI003414B40E
MRAFGWGLLAASSLLIGGLFALWLPIPKRVLGLVMAFGVGVLTSAVAYELVEESFRTSAGSSGVALGLLAGALTFYLGDAAIDRLGGHDRKRSLPAGPLIGPTAGAGSPAGSAAGSGSPVAAAAGPASGALAVVLGIVLDGIPESIVLGLTLVGGTTVGWAVLAAVFLSNLPEAVAATVGLRARGWTGPHILGLWGLVTVVSGLAALFGYLTMDTASPGQVAFINAFAGGAILTMLADTMAPEAFENGGRTVGLATTLGFLSAFLITALT